jgi:hypothetical protein
MFTILLLQILPLQFLLVLPLQMYISFILLSLFLSRSIPIARDAYNQFDRIPQCFFPVNACIDGSSEEVVLTSTSAWHDPSGWCG